METERENTADENKEQAPIIVSAQSTSSEDDCKPQSSKEEEKPTEKEEGENVEEKERDEKMEVDPCPVTAASSDEKGK